jgi:hypothetical protein
MFLQYITLLNPKKFFLRQPPSQVLTMSNLRLFPPQNPDVDPLRGLRSMFGNLFRQVPINERSLHVNPQEGSPLFNGQIPPEIRNEIFILALTEYTTSEYPKNTGYTRPGYTGKRAVSIALLQACRRIYLETYLLVNFLFWPGSPVSKLLGHIS